MIYTSITGLFFGPRYNNLVYYTWHEHTVTCKQCSECTILRLQSDWSMSLNTSWCPTLDIPSCHPCQLSSYRTFDKGKSTFVSFTWMVASKDALSYIQRWTSWTCWGIRFKHSAIAKQCVQNDSVLVSCKLLHLCSFVVSCAMVKRHNCSQIPYVCNFYVYK